jgi:hypothetical protein
VLYFINSDVNEIVILRDCLKLSVQEDKGIQVNLKRDWGTLKKPKISPSIACDPKEVNF